MIAASTPTPLGGVGPSNMMPLAAVSPGGRSFETFADAMVGATSGAVMSRARAARLQSHVGSRDATLGALARQLDELARHRIEAQALSGDLAGAWATGIDPAALAIKMHRHARAMASYNMSVMWGAKLVGVTAGALRQLTAAT
jgi:hypothetical protein